MVGKKILQYAQLTIYLDRLYNFVAKILVSAPGHAEVQGNSSVVLLGSTVGEAGFFGTGGGLGGLFGRTLSTSSG